MIEWLNNIDTKMFLFFNGIHSPFWDQIMWFASEKLTWLPVYLFILYLLYKKYSKNIWIPILAVVILITLSDQSSVKLFKNVFERLRPCHNPEIKHLVHLVNNKCGGKFGFVSSHAANTFALATFTTLIFRLKKYSVFIFSWAVLISYSRIYLGRHYPGDVLGGAILGILAGFLVYKLLILVYRKIIPDK